MLERSYDPRRINEIINDDFVRRDVAGMDLGQLDISTAVSNRNNVLLVGEHGATVCFKLMPGTYEVHTVALREGRGQWIQDFVRAGSRYMFTHTDCFEILTRVPRQHAAARALAERSGMAYEFTSDLPCTWRGMVMPIDIYGFRIQDWIKGADEMEAVGQEFHEFLHSEARRMGIDDPGHQDMPSHNRYVGAAIEMAKNGQVEKSVLWYNRHAVATRHQPISLVGLNPPTVKMDIGYLTFADGKLGIKDGLDRVPN